MKVWIYVGPIMTHEKIAVMEAAVGNFAVDAKEQLDLVLPYMYRRLIDAERA